MAYNKTVMIGRLTKDPELRMTKADEPIAVTQFDIAVDRKFRDKDGNAIADFFRVVAWRNQAENIARYCFKGSQVMVEGELQNRSYEDREGIKRYVTEIQAERVIFLTPKQERETQQTEEVAPDPYKEFGEEISGDDLPF